jgi:glycosyltransferase involved in cell wall biosynthesis
VRVLYFGTYERDYPRNAQVISCLRRSGIRVVERHVPVWEGYRDKFSPGLRRLARLGLAELRLTATPRLGVDVLMVGYPGHVDMLAAKIAARGAPIVFNPLVSLEDTLVHDRRVVSRRSPIAPAVRAVDRWAFRSADLIVADTRAHASYFAERFELPSTRLAVCYVGAEERVFRAEPRLDAPFHVLFVGTLIPLHGIETILHAAALCPEIEFRIVGSGQLDSLLSSTPGNVTWDPWIPYERLPEAYRSAGCALGIFGTSQKAARVIPNKAYHALATGTPLITGDTPAARELLRDGHDALLVPTGHASALAAAVRRLAADPPLRKTIGSRGRAKYEAQASEDVLGRRWREILEDLVSGSCRLGGNGR